MLHRVPLRSDRDPPSSGRAPPAWSTSGWPDGSSSSLCAGACAAGQSAPSPSRSTGPAWRSRSSGPSLTIRRPSPSPRPRRLPPPHRRRRRQRGCSPGAHASEPASPRTADMDGDKKKIVTSVIKRQAFSIDEQVKVINRNGNVNLLHILHLQGRQEQTSRCQREDSEKSARVGRRGHPREKKGAVFEESKHNKAPMLTVRLLNKTTTTRSNCWMENLNLPLICFSLFVTHRGELLSAN